ncbi:pol protein [Cucumis melo var. makuwa]|uniref:Pol protein n=1 Tax=Cucumis melo var. makuwa TaxID=1194695 RepID=A0A5A7SIA8_CUCMM|nr:pol protein [Cucumis melo var. makuwa]
MLSKDKIKACQVEIVNNVLDVTLLVLDMRDFDVILSMDWLSANHASIVYSRKEVVFNPLSAASFKFKGAGTVVLPKVISAMKARKLLSQGTWSILASVMDTREPEVALSSEPMVKEYPDVFSDELARLPPPREINLLLSYYRRFVEDFSRIASSLTQLTRKRTPFVWSPSCESSFQELKQKLVIAPVLTVPDGSGSFVYIDALKKGLGFVLMQQGKANVVADALSRKVSHSAALITKQAPLLRDFESTEITVSVGEVTSQLAQLSVQPTLRQRIIVAQLNDPYLVEKHRLVEAGSPFSMHPGSMKMYQDLKCVYWWRNIKREMADFVVVDRLTKLAHFIPGKPTYTANARFTSKFWKGLQLALGTRLDFNTTFDPQTDGQTESSPITTATRLPLAWHRLRFCMVGVVDLLHTEIRARMLTAQSRQKSYVDERRKDLEFDVGDMVFLKVTPMKGVLRKYVADLTHVVDFESLQINENLSYEEQPVEILAREVKMLRNRGIAVVKGALLASFIRVVPTWASLGNTTFYDCPDHLSVSFGYTKDQFVLGRGRGKSRGKLANDKNWYIKDQFVLGVPLSSPKTRDVPTRSQIARVQECSNLGAEVEVRTEESLRRIRSDRGKS